MKDIVGTSKQTKSKAKSKGLESATFRLDLIKKLETGSPYGDGLYERIYLWDNPNRLVERCLELRDRLNLVIEAVNRLLPSQLEVKEKDEK